MQIRNCFRTIAFGTLMLAGTLSAYAQSTFGTITGVITDPSSAVVRNASVKVINEGTGSERTVVSDNAGIYKAVNLDPGNYTVEVTVGGFNITEKTNIPLLSRETDSIDFALTVASGTQQVEVTSTLPSSISRSRSRMKNQEMRLTIWR